MTTATIRQHVWPRTPKTAEPPAPEEMPGQEPIYARRALAQYQLDLARICLAKAKVTQIRSRTVMVAWILLILPQLIATIIGVIQGLLG